MWFKRMDPLALFFVVIRKNDWILLNMLGNLVLDECLTTITSCIGRPNCWDRVHFICKYVSNMVDLWSEHINSRKHCISNTNTSVFMIYQCLFWKWDWIIVNCINTCTTKNNIDLCLVKQFCVCTCLFIYFFKGKYSWYDIIFLQLPTDLSNTLLI